MEEIKIGKGMAVEVNFDRGDLQDAWFPAIVLEEVAFNSFLVEYIRSRNESDCVHVKATVDLFRIRPVPPKLEVQRFEILSFVEAFHDSCWRKGTIVTIFANGRYGISFNCVKTEQLFCQSEIRPCLVWKNGKWESADRTRCAEYAIVDDTEYLPEIVVPLSSSSTEEKSSSGYTNDAEETRQSKQRNVFEGKASEMDFKDCSSEAAESSKMEKSPFKNTSNATHYAKEKCTSQQDGNVDIVRNESNGLGQQYQGEQGVVETFLQSPAKNVLADTEMVEQELPFTKASSFWKYIDSLDVFRFLPQNPHFSPLIEPDEATREGLAIGHMLIFATLVEVTSKLRIDKSRKVFDSFLGALADLETVGFDVKAVVNRVNNLLSFKARKEQLKDRSEHIYSEMAECDGAKAKAEEEIKAIDEMINELRAKREVVSLEKAMVDSESNMLQMNANRINNDISNEKLHYESLVAEP